MDKTINFQNYVLSEIMFLKVFSRILKCIHRSGDNFIYLANSKSKNVFSLAKTEDKMSIFIRDVSHTHFTLEILEMFRFVCWTEQCYIKCRLNKTRSKTWALCTALHCGKVSGEGLTIITKGEWLYKSQENIWLKYLIFSWIPWKAGIIWHQK